eukprot:2642514-Amphidinium_carterae.2
MQCTARMTMKCCNAKDQLRPKLLPSETQNCFAHKRHSIAKLPWNFSASLSPQHTTRVACNQVSTQQTRRLAPEALSIARLITDSTLHNIQNYTPSSQRSNT